MTEINHGQLYNNLMVIQLKLYSLRKVSLAEIISTILTTETTKANICNFEVDTIDTNLKELLTLKQIIKFYL